MPRCQSSTYLRRIAVSRHPNAPGAALTQGTNPQADPTPGGFALALGASIAASLPPLMKRLSRDEAFLIAVNIAKLPSVPRQILKDIPRPPNSASRDD